VYDRKNLLEIGECHDYVSVSSRDEDALYDDAVAQHGRALDRLIAGYEANSDKRRDLRQEIHLRLWHSFKAYDGRCSLSTWTFRVAHNVAVSHVIRESRKHGVWVSLEDIDIAAEVAAPDIDQQRVLQQLTLLIQKLKPLDRQIMLLYLEDLDPPSIAEITGLTPANVSMKIHRIKSILVRRFGKGTRHADR
jgi:RNA polymerase sigma-70 factor (ECF subfamily)